MDTPHPNTQALPPGTRLEEFEIKRVLGAGGFGITYLATDTSLGRQVVIKENLPVQFAFRDTHSMTVSPRHTTGEDAENFAWSLENFSKEAALLASLDHPGIVKVLRSFRAFGTAFFVMPYVEGVAFDDLIRSRTDKGKSFTAEEISGLLQRVLDALAYLHDRGIYHRDIKPGNILITRDGIPILIDFGSARQRLSERSMTVVESPGYTPFEQLQSRGNVGPWSDLYALGATRARALIGEAPPKANDRVLDDPWVPLADSQDLIAHLPNSLLAGIDQALHPRPQDRWQDARDWAAALAGGAPPAQRPDDDEFVGLRAGQEKTVQQIRLRWCPTGTFTRGSPPAEQEMVRQFGIDASDERQHEVTLTRGFWMAETPVTYGQWKAVMGNNRTIEAQVRLALQDDTLYPLPGKIQTLREFFGLERNANPEDLLGSPRPDALPMIYVNWNEAREYCEKLTSAARAAGAIPPHMEFRLPTEAQWEYACRAGTRTATYAGEMRILAELNAPILDRIAWYGGNSSVGYSGTGFDTSGWEGKQYPGGMAFIRPVGRKEPNAWGLRDTIGNVWEWCGDWYGAYPSGSVTDPTGPQTGAHRVFRGGSWDSGAAYCRVARRDRDTPGFRSSGLGFRPALVPSE
jgi:formylglycine-generating enzyme required for sulfatase activity